MSVKIDIFTGHVRIVYDDFDKEVKKPLYGLFMRLREFSSEFNRRTKRYEKKHVADWWHHQREIKTLRFHSAWSDEIVNRMSQVPGVSIREAPANHADPIELTIKSHFAPRNSQPEYIKWISNPKAPIRVLPANPGEGKTVCTLVAISLMQVRTAIILPPYLVDTWYKAFSDWTTLPADQIRYVTKAAGIKKFHNALLNGEAIEPIVIFSADSIRSYFKNYLTKPDQFPLSPELMFEMAGFGLKVVDEAHKMQHFHMLTNCFTNMRNNIYLTGTLMKEFEFGKMIEEALYPKPDRCPVTAPSSHVSLIGYSYGWNGKLPRHETSKGYSHILYEGGIYKKKRRLKPYLELIRTGIEQAYIRGYQPGDKCLVYFSLTETIDKAHEYFSRLYPDKKVIIYGAGDPQSKLADADIILSTTKKAGTGVDISKLTAVIQSIAISSKSENVQNLMRLRSIPNRRTTFVYLFCTEIPKHVEYHNKRQTDLKPYCCATLTKTSGVTLQ